MTTCNDRTREEIADLFDLPLTELVFRAAEVHRQHHAAGEVQLCTLLSIKTGGCPEDSGHCSPTAHQSTRAKGAKRKEGAAGGAPPRAAKQPGSPRLCMWAAWRGPKGG